MPYKLRAFLLFRLLIAITSLGLATLSSATAAEPVRQFNYDYERSGKTVNMATLPQSILAGTLLETITHDLVLRENLARLGLSLRTYAFNQNQQMLVPLQKQQLDLTVMGDSSMVAMLPQLNATTVAMVGMPYTSVIGRARTEPRNLIGKRIGVTPLSIGVQAVLRALQSAQLKESDVTLVPMQVDAMLTAMEKGEIDAFAAFEPAPKEALTRHPEYGVVFRNANATFLTLNQGFIEQQPKAAQQMMAALARALSWLAVDMRHVHQAVGWAYQARTAFDGKSVPISVQQGAAIIQMSVLDITGLPLLPRGWVTAKGEGQRQFEFLQNNGRLPAEARWDAVVQHMNRRMMQGILADSMYYQLDEYRYAP